MCGLLRAKGFPWISPISYPESSGFLVSGATPGRLWGHQNLLPQDFCGKTMETVTEQPIKKIEFFRCPQSLPGVAPLTKKPEDSGYEIGISPAGHILVLVPRFDREFVPTFQRHGSVGGKNGTQFEMNFVFNEGLCLNK